MEERNVLRISDLNSVCGVMISVVNTCGVIVGTNGVVISPLSTVGGICVGCAPESVDKDKLYNQLLLAAACGCQLYRDERCSFLYRSVPDLWLKLPRSVLRIIRINMKIRRFPFLGSCGFFCSCLIFLLLQVHPMHRLCRHSIHPVFWFLCTWSQAAQLRMFLTSSTIFH